LAEMMVLCIGDLEMSEGGKKLSDYGCKVGDMVNILLDDPSIENSKARNVELRKNEEKLETLAKEGPDKGDQATVDFGQELQLRHVKSGKFLTFKEAFPAEQPANKGKGRLLKVVDNAEVHIDDDNVKVGVKNFRIEPCFAFRQEGDAVQDYDSIYLSYRPAGGDPTSRPMRVSGTPEAFKIDPYLYEAS